MTGQEWAFLFFPIHALGPTSWAFAWAAVNGCGPGAKPIALLGWWMDIWPIYLSLSIIMFKLEVPQDVGMIGSAPKVNSKYPKVAIS